MDKDSIPQLKPQTEAGSVLVPKIDPPAPKVSNSKKPLLIVAAVFLGLVLATFVPAFFVYKNALSLKKTATNLVNAGRAQDILLVKKELDNTQSELRKLQTSLKFVAWTKFIPILGSYVSDLEHGVKAGSYGLEAARIAITTTEPYLDILGFGAKEQAGDGTKTTQERIDFFVAAIPDLIPKVGDISQKVSLAQGEITEINPQRYPVKFAGRQIREPLRRALTLFDEGATFVINIKPLLEVSPYLLGLDQERTYLVLFQNDKELRPTGGFMTAYSIMKVDKAKFEPVLSSDIYNLDAKYKPAVPAPEPIIKYLKGPYLLNKNFRLRDLNWSPDFKESMAVFVQEAQKVGIKDVDGIIAVDTHVLVNLLNVLGKIGVPGFGNFSTEIVPECNCPQVIYELESFADVEGPIVWDPAGTGKIIYAPPNYENRKKIVGPLMNSILANALGQPKEKIPALFEAVFKSLLEKHVLLYLYDEKIQAGLEAFGIAGRLKSYEGDYLHINDANLGGRKSNLYVTTEIEQEIAIARDGSVEKTVNITYKNPEKHDGWLNSVLPNWVRVYVPKGSQLIESTGLEEKAEPYEDLEKTVFAGFFQLRPEGVAKVSFKYKLPFKVKGDYKLLVQKQPGLDKPLYIINAGKFKEELFLNIDKEFKFRI